MTETHPYSAYNNDSILASSPLELVVALYEGAIQASINARQYLAAGDIPARTKAINKIVNILTELMLRLNDEKGGEISLNLRQLYIYIQGRVLEAHVKKTPAPLEEAEKLLTTMLDGWKQASKGGAGVAAVNTSASSVAESHPAAHDHISHDAGSPYGDYFQGSGDSSAGAAYAF